MTECGGYTGLSLLIAVAASGFALYVTSRGTLSLGRLLSGSSLLGFAIAAMHYTGMAAMRVLPPVHHDVGLVALSVVIAIGTSVVALWSAFNLRLETIFTASWKKAGSAAIMGGGICLMHYTGMAAAMFTSHSISTATPENISHAGLAVILGVFTLAFLMATMLVSALDAYYAQQRIDPGKLGAASLEFAVQSVQQDQQGNRRCDGAFTKNRQELSQQCLHWNGKHRRRYHRAETLSGVAAAERRANAADIRIGWRGHSWHRPERKDHF
jgi:hypothetical protein